MWLRLPSIGAVLEAALGVLRRFPLVVACAAAAALAAILMSEDLGAVVLRERLLVAATLGLPLLTATTLLGERSRSAAVRIGLAVLAVGLLAAVHLSWNGWTERIRAIRYAQLSATFHLIVAFLPFAGRDRPRAFWQYNRVLLTRMVVAAVSSGTLFLGLALALAALNKLFGVDLPHTAYFRLWVLCGFVFTTWFFLGGVPTDLDALDRSEEYPAILRVFAQYTLVPLVTVYLVILTLYFCKVVVLWDWPSGWIGYLVSGVAVAGIFALLLVQPLAERSDQQWISGFARAFWLGMLPAVAMLWLAIYQRIHQYGVTEARYFLLVLSLWLGAVAVWYGATRSRRIQVIPTSLCLLGALSFAGPWGAYAASRRSQVARVRDLLAAHGVLAGGRVHKATAGIPAADRRALSGAVRYLVETHGSRALAPLLGDSFTAKVVVPAERSQSDPDDRARVILAALGVGYVSRWETPGASGAWFSFSAGPDDAIPVAGYDLLLRIRDDSAPPAARDTVPVARLARGMRVIRIARGGTTLLDVPLDSILRVLAAGPGIATFPASAMRVEAAGAGAQAVALLKLINGYAGPGGTDVRGVEGVVLLRLRPRR